MKTVTSLVLLMISFIITSKAQDTLNSGIGFGFQLSQYQRDFGIGLNVTSPFFVHDHIGVRLRGNLVFNEHEENGTITWTPYTNMTLGVIGVAGYVADFIRLYGEGGVVVLMPANDFSSDDFVLGGYGLFGFEFFMEKSLNYFIEIGAVGTGAVADKVVTEPIYSNGLLISTGFRVQLK